MSKRFRMSREQRERNEMLAVCGLVAGLVGTAITVALVLRHRKQQERHELEEHISFPFHIPSGELSVASSTPIIHETPAKKSSSLVKQKHDKAQALLKLMKAGKAYTQVELQELSNIPYRSVRRYIEALIRDQKITAEGYGKGRKFSR